MRDKSHVDDKEHGEHNLDKEVPDNSLAGGFHGEKEADPCVDALLQIG